MYLNAHKTWNSALAHQARPSAHHSLWPFLLLAFVHPPSHCQTPITFCLEDLWRTLTMHSFHRLISPPLTQPIPGPDGVGEEGCGDIPDSKTMEKPLSHRINPGQHPPSQHLQLEWECASQRPTTPCFLVKWLHYTITGTWSKGTRNILQSMKSFFVFIPPPIPTFHKYITGFVTRSHGVITSRVIIEAWTIPKLWILF